MSKDFNFAVSSAVAKMVEVLEDFLFIDLIGEFVDATNRLRKAVVRCNDGKLEGWREDGERVVGDGDRIVRFRGKTGATPKDNGRRVTNREGLVADIRYREGGVVEAVKKRKGFNPPEGLFLEKRHEKFRRRRGKDVCLACQGMCCSALHELVGGLIDSGELPADCKGG